MNFNDSRSDNPVGTKTADRKSNEAGEGIDSSAIDSVALDSAQKAQERIHHNENTNSGNTIFSK
jgi:hypothetical protein